MYDLLIVGAGLYGAVFALKQKSTEKSVLVVDKRPNIAGNIYIEIPRESMSISMVLIFSIPIAKKFGTILLNLQNLIVSRMARWQITKVNSTRCRLICTPSTKCGAL